MKTVRMSDTELDAIAGDAPLDEAAAAVVGEMERRIEAADIDYLAWGGACAHGIMVAGPVRSRATKGNPRTYATNYDAIDWSKAAKA